MLCYLCHRILSIWPIVCCCAENARYKALELAELEQLPSDYLPINSFQVAAQANIMYIKGNIILCGEYTHAHV